MRRFRLLLALFPALLLCGYFVSGCDSPLVQSDHQVLGGQASGGSHEYLFCFWNVENFFDDQRDGRTGPGDKEYDGWYADHPEMLQLKLAKLTEALLKMNSGRGP